MAMMLGALYDALRDPGHAEKAQRAAEEVAGYDKALANVRGDLLLLKWMVGINTAMLLGVIVAIVGRLP